MSVMLFEVALNLSPLPKNLELTFSNKSPNLKCCHVKPHGVLPPPPRIIENIEGVFFIVRKGGVF